MFPTFFPVSSHSETFTPPMAAENLNFPQCYIPTTVQWDASPFCDDVWVRNDGRQRCPQLDLPRLSVQQPRRRCPVPERCGGSFEAAWCAVSANPNSRGASTVIVRTGSDDDV